MDALLMLFVSALQPWLLERAKDWAWCPLMSRVGRYAPILNRVTPVLVATCTSAGVTFAFQDGTLTIAGLVPDQMLRGLLFAIGGSVTSHVAYHRAIKDE